MEASKGSLAETHRLVEIWNQQSSMKNFHLNTHPDFVKINELAHWGENHSDPWVRRLAEIVTDVNYLLPLNNDVQSTIDEYTNEVDVLNNTIRDLEFDVDEAERKTRTAQEERDALKFDLNKREQDWLMTELKARNVTLSDELMESRRQYSTLRDDYNDLSKEHHELTEKYNTWKIIST